MIVEEYNIRPNFRQSSVIFLTSFYLIGFLLLLELRWSLLQMEMNLKQVLWLQEVVR